MKTMTKRAKAVNKMLGMPIDAKAEKLRLRPWQKKCTRFPRRSDFKEGSAGEV